MSENENPTKQETEIKKESNAVSTAETAINKDEKILQAPSDWQKQMWENYNDEYSKQLSDHCYDTEFNVKFNDVEGKGEDAILFADPKWVDAKLLTKNLSTAQTDYLDRIKSDWVRVIKAVAMSIEEYETAKLPIPKDYSDLPTQRRTLEREYYEAAARIMFRLKVGDKPARTTTTEDYQRLERTSLKFACDAVHLSFAKPKVKNEGTSSSLYT